MGAVNLQSKSEKTARFSTEKFLATVTADDESSEEKGEGI